MTEELEKRRTSKAVSHFQASLLNERMDGGGKLNLNLLYKRIPPHERAYLFEHSESLIQLLEKTIEPDQSPRQQTSQTGRPSANSKIGDREKAGELVEIAQNQKDGRPSAPSLFFRSPT